MNLSKYMQIVDDVILFEKSGEFYNWADQKKNNWFTDSLNQYQEDILADFAKQDSYAALSHTVRFIEAAEETLKEWLIAEQIDLEEFVASRAKYQKEIRASV